MPGKIQRLRQVFFAISVRVTLLAGAVALFQSSPARADTLISHWALDETSGTTAADSAGTHNGTIGSAATLNQTGQIGTACGFINNNASYVSVGTIPWLPTQTISAWVNSTDTSGAGENILGWSGNAYIQFRMAYGKLNYRAAAGNFNADITSSASIADGQWHHVVAVLTSGALQLYVDGIADGTGNAGGTWSSTSGVWIGGLSAFPGSYQFVGSIDDVALWRGALSGGKVKALSSVLTVNGGALNDYNAATMDTLFQIYDSGNPQAVSSRTGTLLWKKFTGGSGTAGTVSYSGGVYAGWFDDTSGVTSGTSSAYSTWAGTNAPGQSPDQDYDCDGVENGIEYFMGIAPGDLSFTVNPAMSASGTVTWPMDPGFSGRYQVQTSPDLSVWTDRTDDTDYVTKNADSIACSLPPDAGKLFVRLMVTPN